MNYTIEFFHIISLRNCFNLIPWTHFLARRVNFLAIEELLMKHFEVKILQRRKKIRGRRTQSKKTKEREGKEESMAGKLTLLAGIFGSKVLRL